MTSTYRPEPSERGTLANEPLARLLAVALGPFPTGTLELVTPDGDASQVVMARGALLKVRVAKPPLYLGSIAYELGFIGDDDLNASLLEVARTKRLHGALLLEKGRLTEGELSLCLVEQSRRKLHSLFASPPETTFAFYPGFDALTGYGGSDWAASDLRPSIWYGIRAFPPAAHLSKMMATTVALRFQLAPGADASGLGLDDAELAFAETLRSLPRSPEELVQLGKVPRARVEQLLYYLLLVGCLKTTRAHREAEAQRAAAAPTSAAPRPPLPPSGVMPKVTAPRGGTPYDRVAAAKLSDKAYVALRAGHAKLAELYCAKAHEADPEETNHVALRVWIGALAPEAQTADATLQAIAALNSLIVVRDESAHAHFFRGQLYKRLGRLADAARDFRSCLALDPKRNDAVAELRLYAARRSGGQ